MEQWAQEGDDDAPDGDKPLPHEDEDERAALARVVRAFRAYRESTGWEVGRWQTNYDQLPYRHKLLLPNHPAKLDAARQAVSTNMHFITALLRAFDPSGDDASGEDEPPQPPPHPAASQSGPSAVAPTAGEGDGGGVEGGAGGPPRQQQDHGHEHGDEQGHRVNENDVDKVRYVLRNMVRDWSAEGAAERLMSYGKILQELQGTFQNWSNPHRPPRVLIPGAGLARLCVEVAALGYEAQGNEFSYYMLLASSFVLNHSASRNEFALHPWLHSNCNHLTDADQLRPVAVPDVVPSELVPGPGLLSMCAGDFVEVYSAPDMRGLFDSVVTCFFIDTAHNVLRYLEVISHSLAVGGVWINLGPLLYHWADAHTYLPSVEQSVELSLDDIRSAAQTMGFRLVKEESLDVPYMADYRSMYKTVYQAAFWTMVKEREWEPPPDPSPPPPPPPRPPPPRSSDVVTLPPSGDAE